MEQGVEAVSTPSHVLDDFYSDTAIGVISVGASLPQHWDIPMLSEFARAMARLELTCRGLRMPGGKWPIPPYADSTNAQ